MCADGISRVSFCGYEDWRCRDRSWGKQTRSRSVDNAFTTHRARNRPHRHHSRENLVKNDDSAVPTKPVKSMTYGFFTDDQLGAALIEGLHIAWWLQTPIDKYAYGISTASSIAILLAARSRPANACSTLTVLSVRASGRYQTIAS